MTTPIIIDLAILAVLLLFILLGAHRGFILSLCSLVAVVVALVGASFAADALAPKVADAVQLRLERPIQDALDDKMDELGLAWTDDLSIPDVLASLKDKGGIYEWAANKLENIGWSAEEFFYSDNDGISHIASTAANAVAEQLARWNIFIVSFFLVLLAWAILAHALDLVAKLPVLSGLNRAAGGLLGAVKGLVIVYLAAWILCDLTGTIPAAAVAQTHLLLLLRTHDPLELLLLV